MPAPRRGLTQPSPFSLPPQAAEEEEIPKQKEQTHFTVRLTEAKPVDKVKLIKEIKNYIQGINLVQVSRGRPLRAGGRGGGAGSAGGGAGSPGGL